MQKNVLARYPSLNLKVYAVWFNMVILDHKSRWPGSALTDRRVIQFWDQEKLIGRWYADEFGHKGQVAWDIYMLYAPGAESLASQDSIISWGATVLERGDDLRKAVAALDKARG